MILVQIEAEPEEEDDHHLAPNPVRAQDPDLAHLQRESIRREIIDQEGRFILFPISKCLVKVSKRRSTRRRVVEEEAQVQVEVEAKVAEEVIETIKTKTAVNLDLKIDATKVEVEARVKTAEMVIRSR